MNLAQSGRKLQTDVGSKGVNTNEEAIFELNISLLPEVVAEEAMNSEATSASKEISMVIMVIISAYMMW